MYFNNKIVLIAIAFFIQISNLLICEEDERGFLVKVGQQAPDFTAMMIDSTEFKLSENIGKVVILQFTASWCSVCNKEMPHLEKEIWLPNKNKDFILIGIDRDEPIDVVKKFAKATKVTYPLALDPKADIFGLYANKTAGVTRNVVIDKSGKIVFMTRLFNPKEFEQMKEVIKKLLD